MRPSRPSRTKRKHLLEILCHPAAQPASIRSVSVLCLRCGRCVQSWTIIDNDAAGASVCVCSHSHADLSEEREPMNLTPCAAIVLPICLNGTEI
jgi:hypothetical protein